jgi:hypothetical protein
MLNLDFYNPPASYLPKAVKVLEHERVAPRI